jgi:hypothetical protein
VAQFIQYPRRSFMMQKSCSVKNRFLLIPPTGMITMDNKKRILFCNTGFQQGQLHVAASDAKG